MIKKENTKEKELLVRELGIYELRGLAREVGVPSPTKKKREELISLILKKFQDGMIMDPKRRTKGRPYKKLSSIEDIVSSMTNSYENSNIPMTYESIITFAQEIPQFTSTDDDTVYVFEGIARKNAEYMMFYCDNKSIYLKDINHLDKLKIGDKIKVEAKSMGGKNQYIANKILNINNIEASSYKVNNNEKGNEIISNQTIPYGDTNIFVGRRNVYLFNEDLYENNNFETITKYCKENNIKLLLLALNTSFENQILFKKLEFENFTTPFGSSNIVNFNKIIDTINYAQNLIEKGEDVIVFVLDIVEMLRILDKCFVSEIQLNSEHCEQTIIIADKVVSLGRAYEKASLTLVLGYNKHDENEKYLNENVFRISKKI